MQAKKKKTAAKRPPSLAPAGKLVKTSADRRTKPRPAVGVKLKRGNGRSKEIPDWKPLLGCYTDLLLLRFETRDELHAAIDLLWTEPLRTLPHDTPDGKSIVIPAVALPFFTESGLRFSSEKLLSISDFSPEEIRKLRSSR